MRFAHPAELFRLPLVLKVCSALLGAMIVVAFVVEPKNGRAPAAAAIAMVLVCFWFSAYVVGHERGLLRARARVDELQRQLEDAHLARMRDVVELMTEEREYEPRQNAGRPYHVLKRGRS